MTLTTNRKLPKQQWVILLTLDKYGAMSLQELVRFAAKIIPKPTENQISGVLSDIADSGMTEVTVMQYHILTDAGKSACSAFADGCNNGMTPDKFFQTDAEARIGIAVSAARQNKSPLTFIPTIPLNRSNNYAN